MSSDPPETLESVKALYETLTGMIEHAVLGIDDRNEILFANRVALGLFGVKAVNQLIGTRVDRWLPAFAMVIHAEPADSAAPGSPGPVQPARRADGSVDCVTVQRESVGGGGHGCVMLVVRSYGELRRLRARLKTKAALMQMTATPCIIQGPDLVIETVNPAFEHTFGYSADEVIGKRPKDLLTGEMTNRTEMATAFETVQMGGSIKRDEALYRKDGSVVWVSYEQHAVHDELGKISHIVTTGMDISERRKAEQLKSDFVSMVGHELRTPLTVVSGSLDVLGDKRFVTLPEEIGQIVTSARNSCEALKVLINDLLDINQIEAGLVSLSITTVNAARCAEMAQIAVRDRARDHHVTLHPVQGEVNLHASADQGRLCQVLTNLFSNAIKYGRENGAVWTRCWADGDRVVIEVCDDGPGIDADMRARLFEKFSRAPEVAARGIEGFGLGLSICKGLVEQMGGQIVLVSEPGRGAAFQVSLPRAKACVAAVETLS